MGGRRVDIRGTVQGVGFRPWVARLARSHGIRGSVRNDARGVQLEAFAEESTLARFVDELQANPPAGARIVELREQSIAESAAEGFLIERSERDGDKALSIPPDLATCEECARELFDPEDRRHAYAFTNCTACGPQVHDRHGHSLRP